MHSQTIGSLFGVDLDRRREKITRAHRRLLIGSAADIPVLVPCPTYFAIGSSDKPANYFRDPKALVDYQVESIRWHLEHVGDDLVPYVMPWHGTGVVASLFGSEVYYPDSLSDDPLIKGHCLASPADVAKLKIPDPYQDGLMPWVLEAIDYCVNHTEVPVGLTDMQSPLATAGWMCGQTELCYWMYDDPNAVDDLFLIISEGIVECVKAQKAVAGDGLTENQGLQGIWAPPGIGIWLSDDDSIMYSPELYERFEVPAVSRVFSAFGSGILHYCGDNGRKLDSIKKIQNLAAINTCCLGDFRLIRQLRESFEGKMPVIMQENAPIDIPYYFDHLFAELGSMEGIIIAPWAIPSIAMKRDGGSTTIERDPLDVAERIVERVRRNADLMLRGEPILEDSYPLLEGDRQP